MNFVKSRYLIRIVITLGILWVTVFLWGCGDQHNRAAGTRPALEVAVMDVATQEIVLTTELPGRTSAYRVAEIRPQVSGLIQKRLFTEGSEVEAGETLYQIDPAPFQTALDSALAALSRAEANLPATKARAARFEELLSDNAVSRQNYDDAKAAVHQVEADIQTWQAAVQAARINLGYTKITAPISGRIGKSNVTDGAIVTAYQPIALATIQQLDPIYVDVPQSTTELLRLQKRLTAGRLVREGTDQNTVQLLLEDGTMYDQEGTLQFRDVSVDPTTGSVTLRMVFPNPEGVLLPGMFVRSLVKEGVDSQAILIPQQAVLRDPRGNPYDLIVDDAGTVQMRPLLLDRAIDDNWLVASGQTPGDKVIIEGVQRARPGSQVKTVPWQTAGTEDVRQITPSPATSVSS